MLPEVALPSCSLGSQLVSAWRIGPLMVFVATAARPACCHSLWLLGFVLLLLLPRACGQCGALPSLSHAIPSGTNHTEGFPIGTEVTYKCSAGFVKIPGKSDTVVCLSNSQWSNIEEFCGRSCLAPPRLKSATLSDEDLRKNYYPVGTSVSYVCRPGYERTELSPVITCLENLTWAEAPEFCLGKSCGVPKSPEHGRLVDATNNRFGAKVNILCDVGYRVKGRTFIQCLFKGDQVEWSELPTCEFIITQDKPTTVPPKGTEVTGTSSGSVLNTAGNTTAPEGGGLGILIDIGIGTSIGIVVLGAVAAIIPLAVLKKNR
nr:complement decay-accelerating factor-like isoform X1 [Chelonoidis abingdonii]